MACKFSSRFMLNVFFTWCLSLEIAGMQPVHVVVRIRPPFCQNIPQQQNCVHIEGRQQLIVGEDKEIFTFDYAFGPDLTQKDVYDTCVQPLVSRFIEGSNSTVFAYGQTGSGKTFTMGTDTADVSENHLGMIPRAIEGIFHLLENRNIAEYSLTVCYIEIYNEELRDLLDRDEKTIVLRDDIYGNTIVCGVKECAVKTQIDLLHLLKTGSAKRQIGNKLLRKRSSRSHVMFTLFLSQQQMHRENTEGTNLNDQVIKSKFNFIDLAGHERICKSEKPKEFKEGININRSLTILANVISSLAAQKQNKKNNSHIPFRHSKLTRILKDSLEGNARTVMIVCISPASEDCKDTLISLKYAKLARDIKYKPIVNHGDKQEKQELQDQKEALQPDLQKNQHVSSPQRSSPTEKPLQNDFANLEERMFNMQQKFKQLERSTHEAFDLFVDLKNSDNLKPEQIECIDVWILRMKKSVFDCSIKSVDKELQHTSILQIHHEQSDTHSKNKDKCVQEPRHSTSQQEEEEQRGALLEPAFATRRGKVLSSPEEEQEEEEQQQQRGALLEPAFATRDTAKEVDVVPPESQMKMKKVTFLEQNPDVSPFTTNTATKKASFSKWFSKMWKRLFKGKPKTKDAPVNPQTKNDLMDNDTQSFQGSRTEWKMLKKSFKEFKKTSTSQNVLVYEGNEGCGKSSILGHISKILEKKTKKKKKYKNHRIVSLELSDNKECAIKKMYDMLPKREAECHSSEPIDICSAFHAEVLKGPVVFLIDNAHNMDDLSAKSLQLFLLSLQRNVLLIMAKRPFESNNAVNSFFEGPSVVKVNM